MTKKETAQRLADASAAQRLVAFREGLRSLQKKREESALELAAIAEPLAEAMASLVEETQTSIRDFQSALVAEAELMNRRIQALQASADKLQQTAARLQEAPPSTRARPTRRRAWPLLLTIAPLIAAASIAFWIWLDGPARITGTLSTLELGRMVSERYQMMSGEEQAAFENWLRSGDRSPR